MHYLVYHLPTTSARLLPPSALDAHEQVALARRGPSYLLMRSLLKCELARLTGEPAESIRFTYTPQGKPVHETQPFNMSHSGELLCLAFHHRPIGVDIEQMRSLKHTAEVARRIMCPQQLANWQERGCQQQEFYACWCAAEAIVKLQGGSVWHAAHYPFLYAAGRIAPLFEHAPLVELFTPAQGYMGAVAVPAEA